MANIDQAQVLRASIAAIRDPENGLQPLLLLLTEAEQAQSYHEWHTLADCFVMTVVHSGKMLAVGEAVARRLVAGHPDRLHLQNLSRVLTARGMVAEADDVRRQAEAARDDHFLHEVEQAIREAEEELAASRREKE
jgi:hypothetical protein